MSEARAAGGESGATVGRPAIARAGMSETRARAAIARAADATGVDFQYLMAQARLESGLDPSARAGTSSAAGLFQFTDATWLGTLGRHGADHGMGWVSQVIAGGQVRDGDMREQVLGLRFNPEASALMAAELARDNRADLAVALGREPDSTELYLAHFLGSAGARDFLGALASEPGASAAALMPRAAAANRSIFYTASGTARSVSGVMDLLRSRMSGALGEGANAPSLPDDLGEIAGQAGAFVPTGLALAGQPGAAPMGPIAREFHVARTATATATATAPKVATVSMADTLRGAFGASDAALPGNVQSAYGKLARFGL